ncbi:hypothetical protein PHYPSEUDO_001973 [Phytophthora pseudosyringae]|uniref:DET1- and DDB1-associated protein 1 domain-containing protein n=1 Tax=Phytophthora pseudosyringae TaxID=221518 RepID=A0A8T1VUW5_9STRA|nr:hypothetical protein PHYPSEUDO_001973 [Phytophthora pseudosyringae]
MAFTSEKPWPARLRLDTMEDKAPAVTSMAAWPTSSAANFSRLQQEPGVKMIVTPRAYYATHDTMPPSTQVILMASTHSVMKQQYQAADRKVCCGCCRFLGNEGTESRVRRVLGRRSSIDLMSDEVKAAVTGLLQEERRERTSNL